MPQIEVTFDIDANGIVNVSAKDKATNKEQAIRIQASGGLADADIERMVQEAEEHAEEDKKRREIVEAKNQAEALIHATEKTLSEGGDKISEADRSSVTTAVEDLKSAVSSENLDDIRQKSEALAQASMKLGEAMYAAGPEEGEAAAAGDGMDGDGTAGASEDDKVVDADFEEVDDDRKDKTA